MLIKCSFVCKVMKYTFMVSCVCFLLSHIYAKETYKERIVMVKKFGIREGILNYSTIGLLLKHFFGIYK